MNKKSVALFIALGATVLLLNGCMRQGDMGSMQRHQQAMMGGIPEEMSEQAKIAGNPREGKVLFTQNCVACHGADGRGDGPAGVALNPKPANLTRFQSMPGARGEAFLTWAINSGGAVYGTAMPAFSGSLNPQQIQDVVAYINQGIN